MLSSFVVGLSKNFHGSDQNRRRTSASKILQVRDSFLPLCDPWEKFSSRLFRETRDEIERSSWKKFVLYCDTCRHLCPVLVLIQLSGRTRLIPHSELDACSSQVALDYEQFLFLFTQSSEETKNKSRPSSAKLTARPSRAAIKLTLNVSTVLL